MRLTRSSTYLTIAAVATACWVQPTAWAEPQHSTLCSNIADVPPKDEVVFPFTCSCTLLGYTLSSVACQKSVDSTPGHQKCSGSSLVIDCSPDGEVSILRQDYKCECSVVGPDVSIGGVTIGIGPAVAKCLKDGGPYPNGTVTDAEAIPCHWN
jgi:hypothetical protein